MITEQLLDRLDAEHEQLIQPREFDKELRRLARLGIWAEKHAIPTFKDGHNWACSCCDSDLTVTTHCNEALAQLPKQGEE